MKIAFKGTLPEGFGVINEDKPFALHEALGRLNEQGEPYLVRLALLDGSTVYGAVGPFLPHGPFSVFLWDDGGDTGVRQQVAVADIVSAVVELFD